MSKTAASSLLWIVFATVIVLNACQQSGNSDSRPINPNGDSELALLMREMTESTKLIREAVITGNALPPLPDFSAIHTATPTDSTVSSPAFTAFATAYLESVQELQSSDSTAVFRFNHMIKQCMNCHTEFCPGPRKRIRKLFIAE